MHALHNKRQNLLSMCNAVEAYYTLLKNSLNLIDKFFIAYEKLMSSHFGTKYYSSLHTSNYFQNFGRFLFTRENQFSIIHIAVSSRKP